MTSDADGLVRAADRLDELADTAELMGDEDNAVRMRQIASRRRMEAMECLPPPSPRRSDTA